MAAPVLYNGSFMGDYGRSFYKLRSYSSIPLMENLKGLLWKRSVNMFSTISHKHGFCAVFTQKIYRFSKLATS